MYTRNSYLFINPYLYHPLSSRCNPDDPHAAKGYRPRINRAAVKKLLGGVSQGILNSANNAEDELSRQFANAKVGENAGPSGSGTQN